jgi:chromosome segregation ATPase
MKRFLRLFKEYRELEQDLEREAALADSLNRYIESLEGRDRERLTRIEALEAKNRALNGALHEAVEAYSSLRAHLIGLCPNHKEEI